jgi:hypothetical protein
MLDAPMLDGAMLDAPMLDGAMLDAPMLDGAMLDAGTMTDAGTEDDLLLNRTLETFDDLILLARTLLGRTLLDFLELLGLTLDARALLLEDDFVLVLKLELGILTEETAPLHLPKPA